MTESSRRSLAPLLSIALLLLTIIGLIYVISAIPVDTLGELRFRNLAWWVLPLVVVAQLAFLYLGTEIWRRVVRALTGFHMSLASSYMQLAAVSVGKYVPGKVWGFVARTGQMHRQQIPVHLSVTTSLVEQLLLLAGAIPIAVGAGVLAMPQYKVAFIAFGALLLVGVVTVSVNVPSLTRWVLRNRTSHAVADGLDGYHPIGMLRFVFAYALSWILSGVIFCIIYFSLFDTTVSTQRIAALILANTVAITLGFFAFFVPGGLGVREAIATGVLATFMPVREALLAAVAYRAWMIFIDGVNALIMLASETHTATRGRVGLRRTQK